MMMMMYRNYIYMKIGLMAQIEIAEKILWCCRFLSCTAKDAYANIYYVAVNETWVYINGIEFVFDFIGVTFISYNVTYKHLWTFCKNNSSIPYILKHAYIKIIKRHTFDKIGSDYTLSNIRRNRVRRGLITWWFKHDLNNKINQNSINIII